MEDRKILFRNHVPGLCRHITEGFIWNSKEQDWRSSRYMVIHKLKDIPIGWNYWGRTTLTSLSPCTYNKRIAMFYWASTQKPESISSSLFGSRTPNTKLWRIRFAGIMKLLFATSTSKWDLFYLSNNSVTQRTLLQIWRLATGRKTRNSLLHLKQKFSEIYQLSRKSYDFYDGPRRFSCKFIAIDRPLFHVLDKCIIVGATFEFTKHFLRFNWFTSWNNFLRWFNCSIENKHLVFIQNTCFF